MGNSGKERKYCFDNVKFILIFMVVFGHLLRITDFGRHDGEWFYSFIYSIHMPLFIFFSGWFAKFNRRKIVFQLGYLYILMQMLYLLFDHCILEEEPYLTMVYQFTTPYWLLWYLMISIFYYLLIPFIDTDEKRKQSCVVIICFMLSLISGYESEVGYYLALGRFFSFLPFFVLGYYAKKNQMQLMSPAGKTKRILLISGFIMLVIYFMKFNSLNPEIFYGAESYEKYSINISTKFFIQAVALFGIIFFVRVLIPHLNYKIPLISVIGRNTLPIFVLHGFVVKLIGKYIAPSDFSLFEAVLVTIAVLLLLGNSFVAKFLRLFGTGWWLEKYLK